METVFKQALITKIVHRVCPKVHVVFDMSKRAKHLFGTCNFYAGVLKFYRPLFRKTANSCLCCALHEVAHYMQHDISGYSRHDKQFADILKMLIKDYGSKAIADSNSSTAKSYSYYENDRSHDVK